MAQHPPANDDPIQENTPPSGITYKTVTSRMVEDLGKRVVGGQPLTPEDLKGWGPQATRTLSRWLGLEVGRDITNAGNLLSRAMASKLSPENFAEQANEQIGNAKMRNDLIRNYHVGMSSQELTALSQTLNDDQRAFDQNKSKVIGDRIAATGSPPVLANVSASVFKPGDGAVGDKSNGNYKYADVAQDQAMKAANDLLMGRRDQVKATITGWGVNGLAKPFAEWRDHLWPEDLNKASAALTAIGTPEYADQLKKIQSPELKALVEKGNADFNNGKSRNDIGHDFDIGQKQIYGATITLQNDALGVVRAREAQFLAQKQAGQQGGPSVSPAPAAAGSVPPAAAPGGDITKTAQVFAHEPYSKWPALNGWTVENIAKLQTATNDQIRKDRDEALGIAMDAVDNRKRIDDIKNPVMKTIVDRDIAVGEPYEVIAKHIQEAAKSQTAAVNDRIQNTTPGPSPAPQRPSGPGGPGGA